MEVFQSNSDWRKIESGLRKALLEESVSSLSFEELHRCCYKLVKENKTQLLFDALVKFARAYTAAIIDQIMERFRKTSRIEAMYELRNVYASLSKTYETFQKSFISWKSKGDKDVCLEPLFTLIFREYFERAAFVEMSDLLLDLVSQRRTGDSEATDYILDCVAFLRDVSVSAECSIGKRDRNLVFWSEPLVDTVKFVADPFENIFMEKYKALSIVFFEERKQSALDASSELEYMALGRAYLNQVKREQHLLKIEDDSIAILLSHIWLGSIPTDRGVAAAIRKDLRDILNEEDAAALNEIWWMLMVNLSSPIPRAEDTFTVEVQRLIIENCTAIFERHAQQLQWAIPEIINDFCRLSRCFNRADIAIFRTYRSFVKVYETCLSDQGHFNAYFVAYVLELIEGDLGVVEETDEAYTKALEDAYTLYEAVLPKHTICGLFMEHCLERIMERHCGIEAILKALSRFFEYHAGQEQLWMLRFLVDKAHKDRLLFGQIMPHVTAATGIRLDVLLYRKALEGYYSSLLRFVLPEDVMAVCSAYTRGFDKSIQQEAHKRIVEIVENSGYVEMTGQYDTTYTITCKMCHAVVLLAFNSNRKLSFSKLKGITQMNEEALEETLLALLSFDTGQPNGLLRVEGAADSTDLKQQLFMVNDRFSTNAPLAKPYSFKYAAVNPVNSGFTSTYIGFGDLKIQSHINKILKLHKKLSFEDLYTKCKETIGSLISAEGIFERAIEKLIDNQYLKRTKDDSNTTIIEYLP